MSAPVVSIGDTVELEGSMDFIGKDMSTAHVDAPSGEFVVAGFYARYAQLESKLTGETFAWPADQTTKVN